MAVGEEEANMTSFLYRLCLYIWSYWLRGVLYKY